MRHKLKGDNYERKYNPAEDMHEIWVGKRLVAGFPTYMQALDYVWKYLLYRI